MLATDLKSAPLNMAELDAARIRAAHKQMAGPPNLETPTSAQPDGIENLCPFGCANDEINQTTGHCRHMIGFTSNRKTFEPQKKRLRVAREADGKIIRDDNGEIIREWDGEIYTDGNDPQLIEKGDILVNAVSYGRPAVSDRVYRGAPGETPVRSYETQEASTVADDRVDKLAAKLDKLTDLVLKVMGEKKAAPNEKKAAPEDDDEDDDGDDADALKAIKPNLEVQRGIS